MLMYLGTHMEGWLGHEPRPLFVSTRRLRSREIASLPVRPDGAVWALDSGGFTELNLHGKWETSAEDYVHEVRRYRVNIGGLLWAAPQDWMCEPFVLGKTGLTLEEHQRRTVDNFLELRASREGSTFIPVLQGWALGDYLRCVDLYESRGVSLAAERIVGVGSVCRRQATAEAAEIFAQLAGLGLKLHGFGVKTKGLAAYQHSLTSADSLAWSFTARRESIRLPGHTHLNCANCLPYARQWYDELAEGIERPTYRGRYATAAHAFGVARP